MEVGGFRSLRFFGFFNLQIYITILYHMLTARTIIFYKVTPFILSFLCNDSKNDQLGPEHSSGPS